MENKLRKKVRTLAQKVRNKDPQYTKHYKKTTTNNRSTESNDVISM